jgi:hypothetical protein
MFVTRSGKPARRRPPLTVEALEERTVPTLLGQELFPSDNPWNQSIANAPVAADSASIVNAIISTYGNGRLHPDFGQDTQSSNPLYGIPYNVVHGNSTPKVNVVIDGYPDESDNQAAPIPANAVVEGDQQNGPTVGLANRGDSHLLVYDVDNNIGYEFYAASRPSENTDGQWHAAQETVWNFNTDQFRTLGYTSADAAGLPILPGLVRPDEGLPVGEGGQGVINHAIRFTLQNAVILNQFLYPASHTANPGNTNPATQPPMGARFRLKASVDISSLNPESRVIAQAMKDYGMIVADNGSNFFFSGASYAVDASNGITLTWNDNDIQDSVHGLKSLTFSDFEVVDLTPVVTGLSAANGTAGQTITVTGQNFSGAAGHLQVLFGTTPSSAVTVVDDRHVTALVPAGSGTVDVRVQSGVSDPSDPSDSTSPVFGYGTSAVTLADQFGYTSGNGNNPPTVAAPASATPNPVTGTMTALSVLGADDGGEASLTYTWAEVSGPAGASFSINGSNAAKHTTVTFAHPGSYLFRVTITDTGNLSTTSSVAVTVNAPSTPPAGGSVPPAGTPTPNQVVVATPSEVVVPRGRVQLTAIVLDQFGHALVVQPALVWAVVAGKGTVSGSGLYQAPRRWRGTAEIRVSTAGLSATVTVTVRRGTVQVTSHRPRRHRRAGLVRHADLAGPAIQPGLP